MAGKQEDRRIRRTKRLLRQALAELMNEKEFKDITVKEITERADLNRGTFYFHYTDTYDLKEKIEDELVGVFTQMLDSYRPTAENHSAFGIVDGIVEYMQENKYIVRTLFHDGTGDGLRFKFMDALEQTIMRIQRSHVPQETEEEQMFGRRFLAYGIVGCVALWLEQDSKTSVEQFSPILDNLICRIFQ